MADSGGSELKNSPDYQKFNIILGIIMITYPFFKLFLDIILELDGEMMLFPFVIMIGIWGIGIAISERVGDLTMTSNKILKLLIALFIVEIVLSIFRLYTGR